jgi:type I restriction enzyme S subunit
MEQVLYPLPEGWSYQQVKDLVKSLSSGFACNKNYEVIDGYVHLRTHNISTSGALNFDQLVKVAHEKIDHKKSQLHRGEILFNNTNSKELVGKTAYVDQDYNFAFSNHLTRITPNDKICSKFLVYWLVYLQTSGYFSQICKKWIGQAGVNNTFIKELSVPLPPKDEQKRIVEKLDALLTRIDTAIEHLQQSITLADALYASSLDQVFEEVYKNYQTKCLSSLTMKIGSGATPKGGQKAYKDTGTSLIRSLNVYDSVFKPEGLAFIDDNQASKLSNVEVETGDVLLNITGASIARCCIAPDDFLPARVNQHVCIIRPNELLDSQYLNYLLVSPKFKSALLFQGAGGATRQALTKAMISNLEIPLPPLDVQLELVRKVQTLGEKHRALKEQFSWKVSDLIDLKASILDSAFKGNF